MNSELDIRINLCNIFIEFFINLEPWVIIIIIIIIIIDRLVV